MSEPLNVYVCVGSSCHVRGSEHVIALLQALIADRALSGQVVLKGSFCLEHCSAGVTVRVGETLFPDVLPESAIDTLWPEIACQLALPVDA